MSITEKIIQCFPELLERRSLEEIESALSKVDLIAIATGRLSASERNIANGLKAELKRCLAWLKADQCSYIVGKRAEQLVGAKGNAAEYAKIWARKMFALTDSEPEPNWALIAEEIAPEFNAFRGAIEGEEAA